jgi:hypothetical protein
MMKKTFLIFSGLIFLLVSCDNRKRGCMDPNSANYDPTAEVEEDDCVYPPSTKKAVLFFFNDSESNSCGTYGVPLFQDAIDANGSNMIPIALYASSADTLFSGGAVNIASVYDVSGYPDFCVGSQANLITLNAINAGVAQTLDEPANGNVEANFSIMGDSIKITLYGKCFGADSADYFAAAYLLEDNIHLPQAGITDPNFVHRHVLRVATGTSGVGDLVAMAPITSNTSFKKEYSIFIQPNWNTANMKVVGILWRQTSDGFQFVNVNDL